jgi:glyoxylase-like metal-dependent hydrolase (beta-lactamase superfamily II)
MTRCSLALLWLVLPALSGPRPLPAQGHAPPRRIQVADGVHVFVTPPYGDVGLDGNAVAVIGDDGVLVFDANGTPAAAEAVLAGIRALTPLPVRYLVLSHWHWDHWYGAEVYRRAFPRVRIVAQERTRALMMGPALAFNAPGLDSQLPGHIAAVGRRLAEAIAADSAALDVGRLREHLAQDSFFLAQKRGVVHTFPDLTFADSLILRLGRRRIEVRHYDRAVTPGDAFLYLPRERVLVTGDLLVNPLAFALGCYPSGWIRTLERMRALDADVIVPGHGEPVRNWGLLDAHLAVFRELRRLGAEAKGRGASVEQARALADASPRMHALRAALTHDDAGLDEAFGVYVVDWFLHRVYDELDGRLTDAIAPIPQH